MKKIYLSPEIEIENINVTNIIATSIGPADGGLGESGDAAEAPLRDMDVEDIDW